MDPRAGGRACRWAVAAVLIAATLAATAAVAQNVDPTAVSPRPAPPKPASETVKQDLTRPAPPAQWNGRNGFGGRFGRSNHGDDVVLPPEWSGQQLRLVSLDGRIEPIVQRLGVADWAEREKASEELLALPVEVEQLLARLERGQLSLEQSQRLLDAATKKITDQPRGAMGIRMTIAPGGGVLVEALIEGMPAREVLRSGDIIRSINDFVINGTDDLTRVVQSLPPGTRIHIRVDRPRLDEKHQPRIDETGRPMVDHLEADMKLGSAEELDRVDRFPRDRNALPNNLIKTEREGLVRLLRQRYGDACTSLRVPERAPSPGDEGSLSKGLSRLELRLRRALAAGMPATDLAAAKSELASLEAKAIGVSATDDDRRRLSQCTLFLRELEERLVTEPQ